MVEVEDDAATLVRSVREPPRLTIRRISPTPLLTALAVAACLRFLVGFSLWSRTSRPCSDTSALASRDPRALDTSNPCSANRATGTSLGWLLPFRSELKYQIQICTRMGWEIVMTQHFNLKAQPLMIHCILPLCKLVHLLFVLL